MKDQAIELYHQAYEGRVSIDVLMHHIDGLPEEEAVAMRHGALRVLAATSGLVDRPSERRTLDGHYHCAPPDPALPKPSPEKMAAIRDRLRSYRPSRGARS